MLAGLGLDEVLIITDTISEELRLATRNLPRIAVVLTHEIDPYSLIGFNRVLITTTALEEVQRWLGKQAEAHTPAPEARADEQEQEGQGDE